LSAQAKFGEFILAKYATNLRENWQEACRYAEFKNGVSEFCFIFLDMAFSFEKVAKTTILII